MPEAPAGDPAPDGFIAIAIVYSMPEAAVLLATLRAYAIHALPRNQGHISAVPTLMLALGGVWVTVPPTQLEDALALLAEIDTGWRRPPPPFVRNPWLSALASLLVAIFLLVPPMSRASGSYLWHLRPDRPPPPPPAPAG